MFSVDYIHKSQDAQSWNLVNVIIQVINHLHVNAIAFYSTCKGNKTGTKSII